MDKKISFAATMFFTSRFEYERLKVSEEFMHERTTLCKSQTYTNFLVEVKLQQLHTISLYSWQEDIPM